MGWRSSPEDKKPATEAPAAAKAVPAETASPEGDKPAGEPYQIPQVDSKYRRVGVLVGELLQQEHFAKHPIDGMVSQEWVETYMKDLDYNRLFFLQSDLKEFEDRYSPIMGTELRKGDLSPAFVIFQRFNERIQQRLAWIDKRLKQPFDFSKDDYYQPDRSKSDWPESFQAADDLWNRRLKYEILQERLADDKKGEETPAVRLAKRYERLIKNVDEMDSEEVVQVYLSALAKLYDPHSTYLSPSMLEDFAIGMNLKLYGIGAVLTTEDGYCTIKEIVQGGPAALDGRLKVNDKIIGVAQDKDAYVDIVDMRLRNAVRMIRGPKGSVVRLKVIPADGEASAREEISLTRDEIKLTAQRARAKMIELPGADGGTVKLGVIDLPSFYGPIGEGAGDDSDSSSTTDDVKALLDQLKKMGVQGIVLDLRNNGGGLLSEAVRLTGLFIDSGPVVQIKDARGRKHVLEDLQKGVDYSGPLVVLTNKLSASASEIVAGALQNYGRAVIIGDKSTHGKGTVQTVQDVGKFLGVLGIGGEEDAGAVKLTIQKFYLPNGHSTQMRGVIPDIVLPSPNDYLELGEDNLPHALPWDEITPSSFSRVTDLTAEIGQLDTQSKTRLATDEEFKRLQGDIERLRQRLEDKRISLNEKTREQEKKDDENRKKDQDTFIEGLAKSNPPVWSISFDKENKLKVTEGNEDEMASFLEDDGADEGKDKKLTPDERFAADFYLKECLNILNDFVAIEKKEASAGSVRTAESVTPSPST